MKVCIGVKNLNPYSGKRTATLDLLLHGGKAPSWLLRRMKRLGRIISEIIITEFGIDEFLIRLSDPLWFQAFAYVLGYDWDSSGVTTVLSGVLKSVLNEDLGILVAGGKGKRSLDAPNEIKKIGEIFGFSQKTIQDFVRISKLVAKVDNALIQDDHQLYHHTIFISRKKDWIVIQQGMNVREKTARRYHWSSTNLKSFVVEPHTGILGDNKLPFVLDLTSSKSLEAQKISIDLIKDGVNVIRRDLSKLNALKNRNMTLDSYFINQQIKLPNMKHIHIRFLPRRVNWEALKKAYEISPKTFEEFVEIEGIGPGTLRALALVAELIYDANVSWVDPIRYTFAHGGKDGIPYPVNVKRMETVIEKLEDILEDLKINKREKADMLKRLSKLLPRRKP